MRKIIREELSVSVVQKLINDTLVEAIINPWKNKLLKERKRFLLNK